MEKLSTLILEKWMPSIITAVFGGFMVALLVPMIQTHYTQKLAYQKRRVALWEKIGDDFTEYRLYRERLNMAALQQKNARHKLSASFYKQKEMYLNKRNYYGDHLRLNFEMAKFYFNPQVAKAINQFLTWDSHYTMQTVSFLPPDSAYQYWETKIMTVIRNQLKLC